MRANPTPSPVPVAGPRPRRARPLVAAAAAALVLAACGGGDEEAAPVQETPVVEAGQPVEVIGRSGLVLWDVSPAGTKVFVEGSEADQPVAPDQAAITAAADAVATWLDAVLTERNAGLTTTVAATEVDPDAFATAMGMDGAATNGVLDAQIVGATYLVEIGYLGTPGWMQVRVESTLADPAGTQSTRLDTFLFAVEDGGALTFLGLETGA
jgi:hypothetical protein